MDGIQFFAAKKEHWKGPNNIVEMWKDFNLGTTQCIVYESSGFTLGAEHTAEADSEETLESDEDGYPLLPDNVMELRLHRRKAVLRQFTAAARRLCSSNMTPNNISELSSCRLLQASQTYSMDRNCRTPVTIYRKKVPPGFRPSASRAIPHEVRCC